MVMTILLFLACTAPLWLTTIFIWLMYFHDPYYNQPPYYIVDED